MKREKINTILKRKSKYYWMEHSSVFFPFDAVCVGLSNVSNAHACDLFKLVVIYRFTV